MNKATTRSASIAQAILCMAMTLLTQQSAVAGPLQNINVTQLPPSAPVPSSLFGLNLNDINPNQKTTNFPQQAGLFNVWRILVQGGFDVFWGNIQTTKGGAYNWTTLDEYVALAKPFGVKVMFPCTWTPTWAVQKYTSYPQKFSQSVAMADNSQDFINFITALASRYGDSIIYESWNEPDISGEYSGTGAQLATYQQELYQTVKAIAPNACVLGPSFVDLTGMLTGHVQNTIFPDYLTAGGGNYQDVQGWHMYVYPAPPETMIGYASYIRSTLASYGYSNMQIYNTECGWTNMTNPTTNGAGYMFRAYLAAWANGVTNFDYFAWNPTGVVNGMNGSGETPLITNGDGQNSSTFATIDPPGQAYINQQQWLTGSTMISYGPSKQASNIYTSQIVSANGTHSLIIWTCDDSNQTYKIKGDLVVSSAVDILNNPVTISGTGAGRTCPVSATPIILTAPAPGQKQRDVGGAPPPLSAPPASATSPLNPARSSGSTGPSDPADGGAAEYAQ